MKRPYRILHLTLTGDDGLIHVGLTTSHRRPEVMRGKLFHPTCGTRLYLCVDAVPTCITCIGRASTW